MTENLTFKCPGCGAEFEADLALIGSEAECPECQIRFVIPIPETCEGMEIAGYVLKRKIGQGGMGEVWLARHTALDRDVAIKILSPKLVSDTNFIQRFMHEVKIAGKLNHPNIIPAFDAGHIQGLYYMVMRYCDGIELSDRLKIDTVIPEKEALKIVRDIAEALNSAWNEAKIFHRDIKPSNIMIDKKGNARLMDMGISKCITEDVDMTIDGTMVGTPFYVSPEQAKGDKKIDFRADIYSLGATLYHMVTGQVAFDGENSVEIVTKQVTEPLLPPIQVNPGLSDEINHLIIKMMHKHPEDRQASWQNVITDIDLVLAGKHPTHGPGLSDKAIKHVPSTGALKINLPSAKGKRRTSSVTTAVQAEIPQPEKKEVPDIKIGANKGTCGTNGSSDLGYSPVVPPKSSDVNSGLKLKSSGSSSTEAEAVDKTVEMSISDAKLPKTSAKIPPQPMIKNQPAKGRSPAAGKPIHRHFKKKKAFPFGLIINAVSIIFVLLAALTVFNTVRYLMGNISVTADDSQTAEINREFIKLREKARKLAATDLSAGTKLLTEYEGEFADAIKTRCSYEAEKLKKEFKKKAPPADTKDEEKPAK